MKRITLPEPKIVLYEDGFAKHDKLGRRETGERLSDLLERIDEPLVVALDGAWGSGKSFFLKCWVGEHIKPEHDHSATTVYFDAFKMDFLDDPLVALTLEITKQFERDEKYTPEERTERSKKLKRAAWAIGKGITRVGLSAATFGATEVLTDLGDEIAKAMGQEAETFLNSEQGEERIKDFWSTQNAKIAAMEAFGLALAELTEPDTEGGATQKLVIVVDELDRCRPDYALSLLEVIKHFFSVPGVHFVLGVNLKELQNSVRARYGAQVDAPRYLRKFLSLTLRLRQWNTYSSRNDVAAQHFHRVAVALGIGAEADIIATLFKSFLPKDVSLRDAEHVATAIAVSLPCDRWNNGPYQIAKECLTVLYALRPDLFAKVLNEEVTFLELCEFFQLPLELKPDSDRVQLEIWNVLAISIGHIAPTAETEASTPRGDSLSDHEPKFYLAQIARHHFGDIAIDW